MTAQTDPYVRVYYRIMEDPKFANVYDDKAALGTWLTLLIHADALYPSAARLPHGVRRANVEKLVKAGLIELEGNRFRVHGLEAERGKRAETARFAADVKHHGLAAAVQMQSERTALAKREQSGSSASAVPLLAEPLRASPNRTEPTRARERVNGSKNETDQERHARYLALRDDPSQSADIRYAARAEVDRLEAVGVKP